MGTPLLSHWSKTALLGLLLPFCAGAHAGADGGVDALGGLPGIRFAKLATALECRQALASGRALSNSPALDSSNIRVLNWNIKKGEERDWERDLSRYASDKQLVLLQEAALSMELTAHLQETAFAAFSPGYVKDDDVTGVVTFSGVEPVSHCRLKAQEPWLGTAKATNITQYALSGSQRRLIVVNIHALNFSLGLVAYRQQLAAVAGALGDHDGPVIFAGDFNTWRPGRRAAVDEYLGRLGLQAVRFDADHRHKVFGMPLDHVFFRGLKVLEAAAFEVSSSDHNPMMVSFALD